MASVSSSPNSIGTSYLSLSYSMVVGDKSQTYPACHHHRLIYWSGRSGQILSFGSRTLPFSFDFN